jgi:redox-sensitive bicupin YhaK (pirin superfamily)
LKPHRLAYVQLVKGTITVNGQALEAGDALMVRQENELRFSEGRGAELLVFDLKP